MKRLLGVATALVAVSCGTRTEIWSSGPGPLDGSVTAERQCPKSRPRLNAKCSIGDPPYACTFEAERCPGGPKATRVYSCYAGRKGDVWFYGSARACSCPAELPEEGSSCDGPSRNQGDCKYYAAGCGSSCSCVAGEWSCQSACSGPAGGCPATRPARFLPCAPTGLSCTYPDPSCATTSACVAREGAPPGADGVWVTVASPDTCDDI